MHDKHPMVTSLIKELLGKDLMKIDAPSKIYHKGRLIDFPLKSGLYQLYPLPQILLMCIVKIRIFS